jgi:hypothetical protein
MQGHCVLVANKTSFLAQDFKMKKLAPRGKENIVTSLGENLGELQPFSLHKIYFVLQCYEF